MKVALTKRVMWLCCLHEQRDLCWGELGSRDTNEELEVPQETQCYKVRKKQQLKFHILMKIIGQICHGELFMHMSDRITLKKWNQPLRFCLRLLEGDKFP